MWGGGGCLIEGKTLIITWLYRNENSKSVEYFTLLGMGSSLQSANTAKIKIRNKSTF